MKPLHRNLIIAASLLAPPIVGWLRGINEISGLSSTVGLLFGILCMIIIGGAGVLTSFLFRKRPNQHYSLFVYSGLSFAACLFLLLSA